MRFYIKKEEEGRLITVEKIRPDGRKGDEIRPLASEVGILSRTHGSGLFTRGQTQALSICTLGALGDVQIFRWPWCRRIKTLYAPLQFPII